MVNPSAESGHVAQFFGNLDLHIRKLGMQGFIPQLFAFGYDMSDQSGTIRSTLEQLFARLLRDVEQIRGTNGNLWILSRRVEGIQMSYRQATEWASKQGREFVPFEELSASDEFIAWYEANHDMRCIDLSSPRPAESPDPSWIPRYETVVISGSQVLRGHSLSGSDNMAKLDVLVSREIGARSVTARDPLAEAKSAIDLAIACVVGKCTREDTIAALESARRTLG